jgi:phosphate uptake regulator
LKRKVIQIAGSTCLVSLPKEWVKKHDVKKGAELEVQEQGNKVVVSTEKSQSLPKIVIEPSRFGRFHPNFLSAAYHMGFDDVEIRFLDSKELESIQARINACIGYEIVNQSNSVCSIKSVSEVSTEEFNQIIRKVFLLLINMGENSLELLEKGDFARLSEVIVLENTNNKLTDFCKRVLNKKGYHDYSKLTTIYTICMYLERVADEYRDICNALMGKKEKLSPSVLKDFKEVNQLFADFYNHFYTADRAKLEKIFFTAPQMKMKLLDKLSKALPADRVILHASSNILDEIYEMATATVELHI